MKLETELSAKLPSTNIIPKEIKDDDGNVLPGKDATDTDEDYTEDIIATLIDDAIITSNGKYTVMVIDQAGNVTYQNVEVTNISKNTNSARQGRPGRPCAGIPPAMMRTTPKISVIT